MSQHDGSSFESDTPFDFASQNISDSAQSRVTEFVLLDVLHDGGAVFRIHISGKFCSLGNHYDAEVASASMAQANSLGNFIDIEGTLGNQNHIGTAGNAAVNSDPTSIATHYFHHHDTVVSFRGGMHAVDGLSDNVDRGIESESVVGAGQVIVNGLGNAYYFHAFFMQFLSNRKGVIPANCDQRINLVFFQGGDACVQAIGLFSWICA